MANPEALKAHIADFNAQADALEKNLAKQPDKKARAALSARIDGIRDGVTRTESEIEMLESQPPSDPYADAEVAVREQALAAAHREVAIERLAGQIEGKSPQEVIGALS